MNEKDPKAYIDLIIAACEKITSYIDGVTEETFAQSSMMQSAVILQLQVIGETAKKIDESTRRHIDAPWSMIIGLRNIIAHEYFMLELATIWRIASRDVPDLEKSFMRILRRRGPSTSHRLAIPVRLWGSPGRGGCRQVYGRAAPRPA